MNGSKVDNYGVIWTAFCKCYWLITQGCEYISLKQPVDNHLMNAKLQPYSIFNHLIVTTFGLVLWIFLEGGGVARVGIFRIFQKIN